MPEYELFLIKDFSELKEGVETIVNVRDLATVETRQVKAILSSKPGELPGGDTLWIRWQRGQKHPQPWAIKIIQDISSLGEAVGKEYY
ncbi:MAG: phenylphosphate carboxylase subunit gamma [Chloroflexi bacterium]|nr:phenylphosphate carboxylase subunit gamma [Chloroflexota bacterium]